jgi:hypothetical protein
MQHLEQLRLAERVSGHLLAPGAGLGGAPARPGNARRHHQADARRSPRRSRAVPRARRPPPGESLANPLRPRGTQGPLRRAGGKVLRHHRDPRRHRLPRPARQPRGRRAPPGRPCRLLLRTPRRGWPPPAAKHPPSPRAIVRPLGMPLEQQIHHRGPVWLDHVDAPSAAPYGLGAELQEHLARRHAQLQSLGIDPVDPKRLDALRELERRTVGEGVADRSGQSFLQTTPEGFRGRSEIPSEAPMAPRMPSSRTAPGSSSFPPTRMRATASASPWPSPATRPAPSWCAPSTKTATWGVDRPVTHPAGRSRRAGTRQAGSTSLATRSDGVGGVELPAKSVQGTPVDAARRRRWERSRGCAASRSSPTDLQECRATWDSGVTSYDRNAAQTDGRFHCTPFASV